MSERNPEPVKWVEVYDKRRPEGQRSVAQIQAVTTVDGKHFAAFMCERTPEGLNVLSKQHAVEFASALLMLALGMPGDIPAGDVGVHNPQNEEDES